MAAQRACLGDGGPVFGGVALEQVQAGVGSPSGPVCDGRRVRVMERVGHDLWPVISQH